MDAGIFCETTDFCLVQSGQCHACRLQRRGRKGPDVSRNGMFSATGFLKRPAAAAAALAVAVVAAGQARADDGFPFGFEMTLDAARQPGSKRIPTLEIGDNGEATLDLWCKSGKGQFSVA